MASNKPYIANIEPLIAAGIDPKTGLPAKVVEGDKGNLKPSIKKLLRIIDEQTALNRYTWYNLPDGLTSQLIERILYYKGQGMFFYDKATEKFYFLPYALDGGIDIYGQFQGVRPLPFNGTTEVKKDGKLTPMAKYITSLVREPLYDVWIDEVDESVMTSKCVLLSDYSKQISQTNIPRQQLNDPLLDVMADCVPFMRTALLNGTGVAGMRVNSQDEYANVKLASAAIDAAALNGEKYVPIVGNVDFQDLAAGEIMKAEEFLLAMQSLDNFRLSTYGLDNGGLFQKKSHMLEAEQEMNAGCVGLINQDGLDLRQHFCDILNSVWPLGIWCEISENVIGMDMNGDGLAGGDEESMPAQESEGGTEYAE